MRTPTAVACAVLGYAKSMFYYCRIRFHRVPHATHMFLFFLVRLPQVIHHAGHIDYVVNGRLLHPIGAEDGSGEVHAFEDHGAIRALDDDFVTFYETLDVLSENADQAVESFCDLCE